MKKHAETAQLWLRLAQVDTLCVLWRAAGNLERWQESKFVAAMLTRRLAHRLQTETGAGPSSQVLEPHCP